MEVFEIGGIKYQRKSEAPKPKMSKHMASIIGMAQVFQGLDNAYRGIKPKQSKVIGNIPKEFALILEKKSNLTSNERKWVVERFKRDYEQVF